MPRMQIVESCHAIVTPENWLWRQDLSACFSASQPMELDLGCGKGRFLLARAMAHPKVNFFAIERQLKRVRKIDGKAKRRGIHNVALLRLEAYYAVRYLLPKAAFRTVYIFHPDPWPKARHAFHRMLGESFIDALHEILEPGGVVHFSTDHLPYFYDVLALLEPDTRFEEVAPFSPLPAEETDFERLFKDRKPIGRYSMRKRVTELT